jgi:hypothetical protein
MTDHDDLFSNEGILPAQFYANRGERLNEPIKRLALAVLEDGLRCLQRRGNDGEPTFAAREAARWLYGATEGIFSFEGICETLGYDAAAWREHLKDWEGKIAKRSAVNGNGGVRPTLTRYRGHRERGRV